ncbi:hypothetical protein AAE478_005072 [Parahypoxylon ruwenzoriense]
MTNAVRHRDSRADPTEDNGYHPVVFDSPEDCPLRSSFGASANLDLPVSSPRSILDLRADPAAQHSAIFILEAIRGLPLTMTSRETFSWFSHGYWYQPDLPQNIARCSELAKLYIDRKSPDDDSFWPMVDEENRRLLRDISTYSFDGLISGMQAQIIYMIMFALDSRSTNEVPGVRLQMLMAFEKCTEIDECAWFFIDELENPSVTWEEWVHAETRRRCAIIWFLLSRVIDLKFGVLCSSITSCRSLPLPSPGSLWSARTRTEWESFRKMHCREPSLRTFGDLIEARSYPSNSERGRKLNKWHASCDKLGLLLTLATSMI